MYANPRPLPKNLEKSLLFKASINKKALPGNKYT